MAGLDPHSPASRPARDFASLLIYEGRNVIEVADQLGRSLQMRLQHYTGVFAEAHADERVGAELAIARARAT